MITTSNNQHIPGRCWFVSAALETPVITMRIDRAGPPPKMSARSFLFLEA